MIRWHVSLEDDLTVGDYLSDCDIVKDYYPDDAAQKYCEHYYWEGDMPNSVKVLVMQEGTTEIKRYIVYLEVVLSAMAYECDDKEAADAAKGE